MKLLNDQPLAWDKKQGRYDLATVDTLGRDELAGQIADVVRAVDPPFTIAVYGTWGEGKTHLLKSVERHVRGFQDDIDHPDRPAFQTVWFDLWQHQHDDQPALALLQAAVNAIARDAEGNEKANWQGLWEKVARVGQALLWTVGDLVVPRLALGPHGPLSLSAEAKGAVTSFKDNWEALAQARMEVRDDQTRLHELFHKALDALAGEAKVAFFVDDLDRCLPDKTIELLEQIKLFLDHPRCVFVLGLDARAVTEAVRTVKAYKDPEIAERYLEKMIQCAFDLPPVEDQANRRFVEDALRRAANPSSRGDGTDVTAGLLDLLTADQVTSIAELWLPAFRDAEVDATPRLIVRTVNTFLVDHAVGRGSVKDAQGHSHPRIQGYDPRVMAALAPLKTCYRKAFDYLRRHHDSRPGLLESLLASYDGDPLDATLRETVFQGEGARFIEHVRDRMATAGLLVDRDLAEAYFKLAGSAGAGAGQTESAPPGGTKRGPRSRAEVPEEIPEPLAEEVTPSVASVEEPAPAPSRRGRPAGGVPQRTVDVSGLVEYERRPRSSEAEVAAAVATILDRAPEPSRSVWLDTALSVTLSGYDWRVLEVAGEPGERRALLLADRVVGSGPYHRAEEAVTWADCDLRAWLNSEFLAGLGKPVVDQVTELTIENAVNPTWDTPGGPASSDRILLLSVAEAAGYLTGQWEVDWRKYRTGGWFTDKRLVALNVGGDAAWWWLRSPGNVPDGAAGVYADGYLDDNGDTVAAAGGGVRPALWLNLESPTA
jgi:hypothetical protein